MNSCSCGCSVLEAELKPLVCLVPEHASVVRLPVAGFPDMLSISQCSGPALDSTTCNGNVLLASRHPHRSWETSSCLVQTTISSRAAARAHQHSVASASMITTFYWQFLRTFKVCTKASTSAWQNRLTRCSTCSKLLLGLARESVGMLVA